MQDKMKMNHDELCREAARAVDEASVTQTQLARDLDVSPGAVSRALSESGPKFASLQRRILEHLTPYRIRERVVFEVQRRYEAGDAATGERHANT
jgi:DNA transposition AAA+ family ATPase